jgi:hypothetical protein
MADGVQTEPTQAFGSGVTQAVGDQGVTELVESDGHYQGKSNQHR